MVQLIAHHHLKQADRLESLLEAAVVVGLQAYISQDPLQLPVDFRLAFRELALSIGLRALGRMQVLVEANPGIFGQRLQLQSRLESLRRYYPLVEEVETFWLE